MLPTLRRLGWCVVIVASLSACMGRGGPTSGDAIVRSQGAGAADKVLVLKSKRQLILYSRGAPLVRYRVALGTSPRGPKWRQGDGRTPEGRYVIDWRNPDSAFHKSLHISYPNARDRARAKATGQSPGGMIMIHGLPNGLSRMGNRHVRRDWTNGCIAVTNAEIEEIWRLVPDGTPIEIRP